ncbi:response regulator receiver protein [Desulfosarcina variabilis str. Montpellier]|uniref:AAA family ATPase n=1 Tax=Desulfosarcina variabilis TaxID=2300 RepID=UPI003AFA1D2D
MSQQYSVSIKTQSRQIGKDLERIVLSAGGFRFSDSKKRPDILIFHLGEAYEKDFDQIESLSAANAIGEIFIVSEKQDTNLLRRAMRLGVKEFLSCPLIEKEVHTALAAFKKRILQSPISEPTHNGRIIHMMGAKGGVGTTTVAANLAMMIAELKNAGSVALVDLNTVFGEIPLFLSVKPNYHWGQIIKSIGRLDSTFLLNAMAKHPSGVHVLPSPSYLNGHPPATAEVIERLLTAMKKTFDFIIVDGGQSLEGPVLKTMEMSDQIVLLTLLSLPCLHNTNNVFKSLAGLDNIPKDRIKLVINRFLKKSDISIPEAEDSIKSEIFWKIPNDYKTSMSAINRGKPIYEISARAGITKSLAALADALIDGNEQKPVKNGWRLFGR